MSAIAYHERSRRSSRASAAPSSGRSSRPARRSRPRSPRGGLAYLFGSGHSVIPVMDVFPRYGSFVGFVPLYDPRLMWSNVVGAGRRARAALDRAPGGLRARLPPELPAAARATASSSSRTAASNAAPIEAALYAQGARAHGDHRVLARKRRGGDGRPTPPARSCSDVADIAIDNCVGPGGRAGGRRAGRRRSPRARRWPSSSWRWRSSPRPGPGSWRRGTRPTTFVSPNVAGRRGRPQPARVRGLRAAARRAGRAVTRAPPTTAGGSGAAAFAGMFLFGIVMALLGAILPLLSERLQLRPRAGGHALPRDERLHAGLAAWPSVPCMDRFGMKPPLVVGPAARGRGAAASWPRRRRYAQLAPRPWPSSAAGGGALNSASNTLVADLYEDPKREERGPQPARRLLRLRRALHPVRDRAAARAVGLRGILLGGRGSVPARRGRTTRCGLSRRPKQARRLALAEVAGFLRDRRSSCCSGAPALLPVRQRVRARTATSRPSSPARSE